MTYDVWGVNWMLCDVSWVEAIKRFREAVAANEYVIILDHGVRVCVFDPAEPDQL